MLVLLLCVVMILSGNIMLHCAVAVCACVCVKCEHPPVAGLHAAESVPGFEKILGRTTLKSGTSNISWKAFWNESLPAQDQASPFTETNYFKIFSFLNANYFRKLTAVTVWEIFLMCYSYQLDSLYLKYSGIFREE
ncbi:hypothetical protein EK904_000737 [Melospiza melodia maxima]|nr:hypothetical protein EK904_000737 [Melospiza melodia maxima]